MGTDCEFCQWRLSHPIELGWEKLWDANCDLTANFALSTQQTADFLVDKDFDTFNNFPDIDATVEKVLSEAKAAAPVSMHTLSAPASTNPPLPINLVLSTQQIAYFVVHTDFDDFPDINATVEKLPVEAKVAGPVSVCSPSAPASMNPPLPTMPTSAACAASRKACIQGTSAARVYGSPKSDKAVARAIASGIPQKTKMQTDWTVRVWEQWAKSQNSRLLPAEKPFSAEFGSLTRSEMQFWLCHFVLETRKTNGEPYNSNTLYQICCGLL